MARSVSADSDLSSFKSEVDNLKSSVDRINLEYNNSLSTIDSNYRSLDYSDWSDDVKDRLQVTLDRDIAKDSVSAINNDLSSGGMKDLSDTTNSLSDITGKAVTSQNNLNRAKEERKSIPDRIGTGEYKYTQNADWRGSAYGGSGNYYSKSEIMKDNPAATEKDQEISRYQNELNGYITQINDLLAHLPTIIFSGVASGDTAASPVDTSPVDTSPSYIHNNTSLNRENYEYEGGRKVITINMTDDDSPTGTITWEKNIGFETTQKTIEVRQEEDGNYYEYLTYVFIKNGEEVTRETTRRKLSGQTVTYTVTVESDEGTYEQSVVILPDSEFGQYCFNQLINDYGITGFEGSMIYIVDNGIETELPGDVLVTITGETSSGSSPITGNGMRSEANPPNYNDPNLTVISR